MTRKTISPRKGMPDPHLPKHTFMERFVAQFQDPAFDAVAAELSKVATAAWESYSHHRKSPRTRKAGPEFADPDYDLAVDWVAARPGAEDRAIAARRGDSAVTLSHRQLLKPQRTYLPWGDV